MIEAAVGHHPVGPVRVRPVDGLAVAELLGVHAVAQAIFAADRVAVEASVTVPGHANAGANINRTGRGDDHVRVLGRLVVLGPVAVFSLRVLRQNLQVLDAAGEEVRVTHERARVGELPDVVTVPAGGNTTHDRGVAGQVQRQGAKLLRAHALGPPGGCGVHHGRATGQRAVGVHEVADPGGQLRRGHVVAGVAVGGVGVELDVQQARESLAVVGPAAAVLHEVAGLIGTGGGAGVGEVVGAVHHANGGRAAVLLTEVGVGVVRALGGLHVGESGTGRPGACPVHVLLVRGDVHAEGATAGGPGGAARGQRLC